MSDPIDPPEPPDDHDPREPQGDGDRAKPYKVGYGKPPVETRFVKGQSGNPLGRPRKPKPEPFNPSNASFLEMLTQEAHRPIALRENGRPIKLPAMQAAMRSLWAEAIKGRWLSQNLAFGIEREAEAERAKSESSKYDWLWELKATGRRMIAECNRSDRPVPELYPHPDDIILDRLTGETHVDGPLSREHAYFCEYMAANRDFFLLYSEHLKRTGGTVVIQQADRRPICAFLVFAHIMNLKLPTCYRWPKLKRSGGFDEMMGHQTLTREESLYDDQGFALMWEYSLLSRRELKRRVDTETARVEIMRSKCPNFTKAKDDKLDRMIRRWKMKMLGTLKSNALCESAPP